MNKEEKQMMLESIAATRQRKEQFKKTAKNIDYIREYVIRALYNGMTAQSYGAAVEQKIIDGMGWTKDKSKTAGDALTPKGDRIEIKFSVANITGGTNYVQLRPHYTANKYLLVYYYPEEDRMEPFLLSKEDTIECILKYGGYAHGSIKKQGEITAENLSNNEYEYAIRPNILENIGDECLAFMREKNTINNGGYECLKKIILN